MSGFITHGFIKSSFNPLRSTTILPHYIVTDCIKHSPVHTSLLQIQGPHHTLTFSGFIYPANIRKHLVLGYDICFIGNILRLMPPQPSLTTSPGSNAAMAMHRRSGCNPASGAEGIWAVTAEESGERIDALLARSLTELSRSAAQRLRGGPGHPGRQTREEEQKDRGGRCMRLELPEPVLPEPLPQDIPLEVVYEDADLIVVNKPRGLVVHPARATRTARS